MSGAHGWLYRAGSSLVHRLAPEAKTVALLAYTVVLVATPREEFGAFAGYGVLLMVVTVVARIPVGWLATRMLIEVPFVALAVLLPFVGSGTRVEWFSMSLSVDGLYGGWNILIKGTLGVWASLLLAATTSSHELLVGLERLRVPSILVQIARFMVRYVDVLLDEARRMRIARLARAHNPRFLWQAMAFARGLGTLFVRSFERGERVYVAMLSRGYFAAGSVGAGSTAVGSEPTGARTASSMPSGALPSGALPAGAGRRTSRIAVEVDLAAGSLPGLATAVRPANATQWALAAALPLAAVILGGAAWLLG